MVDGGMFGFVDRRSVKLTPCCLGLSEFYCSETKFVNELTQLPARAG
jgi:hypothetical protein